MITIIGLFIQCSGIFFIVLFYLNKHKLMHIIDLGLKIGEKIKLVKNRKRIVQKISNNLSYLIKTNLSINFKISIYILTFTQILSTYSISFFIAKSFGLNGFPILDMIAIQAFISMLSTCTPLPGAAGTVEGAFLILYSLFFRQEDIFISMILFRLISYYFGLFIGLLNILKK